MYSSTDSVLSSGIIPATAFCSLKYDIMDLAEPSSISKSETRRSISSSSP